MRKLLSVSLCGVIALVCLAMLLTVHPTPVKAQEIFSADNCGVCTIGGPYNCNGCHMQCAQIYLGNGDYGPDCVSCGGGLCLPYEYSILNPIYRAAANVDLARRGLYAQKAKGRPGYVILKNAARHTAVPHMLPGSPKFTAWLTAYVTKYPCQKKQAKTGL